LTPTSARRVALLGVGIGVVGLLCGVARLHATVRSSPSLAPSSATSTEPITAADPGSPAPLTGISTAGTPPAPVTVAAGTRPAPVVVPPVASTPPEPPPLAPLQRPPVGGGPVANPADVLVDSTAAVASAAALGRVSAPQPRDDVVDDSRPITGSVFDREDLIDRHPVNSDRSITESTFDREDLKDDHPVP
jgi:hypothetical protein